MEAAKVRPILFSTEMVKAILEGRTAPPLLPNVCYARFLSQKFE